jgi:membrane peptidoglycan carboxypeptidase
LSTAECALLAGLVQYPAGYNPLLDPEAAKGRQLTVLRLMKDAGYLTAAQVEETARELLQYRSRLFRHRGAALCDVRAGFAGAAAWRRKRCVAGGLRVYTTLDLDLQRQAEAAVRRRLAQLTCTGDAACDDPAAHSRRVDNAAAVVLDSATGEILSLVGSPDYFSAQISGNVNAALARRQPGSAIKPFTYAAALDPAWSAAPVSRRSPPPASWPTCPVPSPWRMPTAPLRPIARRTTTACGTARSACAPHWRTATTCPPSKRSTASASRRCASSPARPASTTFTGRYGLALTLGGGEVRLLDLTAAYGIFDDGRTVTPRAILGIEGLRLGRLEIGDSGPISNRPISQSPNHLPQTAYLLTDILADDVARSPAFGRNSVLNLAFPAAVKTGTTTDWRDNWTVGYSTQRLVGVWVGNADNAPMVGVSGVDGAGPIWHDLMRLAHPQPPAPLPSRRGWSRSKSARRVGCCRPRSARACAASCSSPVRSPPTPDGQFQRIALDRATGLPADAVHARRTPHRARLLAAAARVSRLDAGAGHPHCTAGGAGRAGAAQLPELAGNKTAAAGVYAEEQPRTPLRLIQPDAFAAYQLHPGLPAANQRLRVEGIVADGGQWAELRLVVDGDHHRQCAERRPPQRVVGDGARRTSLSGLRVNRSLARPQCAQQA